MSRTPATSPATSSTAKVRPVTPSWTTSVTPPTLVETTGSPAAIASTTTSPKVSSAEVKAKMSALA